MACDDLVLAHTANPRAYAECLVSLAEKNFVRRGLALAQAAVGRMRQTSARVIEILDMRRPQGIRVWKPAPWVVAGFSVACPSVAAHAPKLVAFGDPQTSSTVRLSAIANLRDVASSYTPPVVPASYVVPANGFASSLTRKSAATRGSGGHTSSVKQSSLKTNASLELSGPRVHKTKSSGRRNVPSALVVRASFRPRTPGVAVQQAVFVFGFTPEPQMQTENQDEDVFLPLYFSAEQGTLWHVTIWRITVLGPAAVQQSGVPSKSI